MPQLMANNKEAQQQYSCCASVFLPERFPGKQDRVLFLPVAPPVHIHALQICVLSQSVYLRECGNCSFGAAGAVSPETIIRIFY